VRKTLLILTAGVAIVWALLVVLSQRPGEVGLVHGALQGCEDPDRAIGSQIAAADARVDPLYVGPDLDRAWAQLEALIERGGPMQLRAADHDWMALTWRSMPWGITDDIEVLRLQGAGILHVRSASRLGALGFGTHRTALEHLRNQLSQAMAETDGP